MGGANRRLSCSSGKLAEPCQVLAKKRIDTGMSVHLAFFQSGARWVLARTPLGPPFRPQGKSPRRRSGRRMGFAVVVTRENYNLGRSPRGSAYHECDATRERGDAQNTELQLAAFCSTRGRS